MMAIDDTGVGYGNIGTAPVGPVGGRKLSREMEIMGAGALILVGAFVYPYVQGLAAAITPGCLFYRITGLPCLLCGMTRSVTAAAHGHIGEAFRMHLLGPPFILLVLAVTVLLAAEYALSRHILPRPSGRTWKLVGWGTLGLLVAAWVARLVFFGVNI